MSDFGFKFGSMSITRTAKDDNGVAIISIKTPKATFSVRATKTGQIRFYDARGNECELVNSNYVAGLEKIARKQIKEVNHDNK